MGRFVAKKRSDLNDKEWIYYARFIKAMGFNVKIYRMWSPKPFGFCQNCPGLQFLLSNSAVAMNNRESKSLFFKSRSSWKNFHILNGLGHKKQLISYVWWIMNKKVLYYSVFYEKMSLPKIDRQENEKLSSCCCQMVYISVLLKKH